ncbi:MAG: hypothetical protein HY794_14685 [Desulfarculus sp.]|nr:hypothetical protein [Desulfarculus sp.]
MKKIASATALIVALAIPGLAFASAPKVGDKLNLCEKQGAYTLMQAKDKCDGNKVDGSLKAIKDGKMEVDVKGKKVMVDLPKAVDSKAAPAKAMPASALKAEPTKAPETKAITPAPAVKAEPVKAPETKAAPEKK